MSMLRALIVTMTLMLAIPQMALASSSKDSKATKQAASATQVMQGKNEQPIIPEHTQPGRPITLEKMTGKTVKGSDGQVLGTVKDLVINEQGRITHLILQGDGLFNEELIPVPWALVEMPQDFVFTPADNDVQVSHVTQEMIKDAPRLEEPTWPQPDSATDLQTANEYFRETLRSQLKAVN